MAIDLFSIGKFTIHGYGLMIALGFLFALIYGMWQCKKKNLNEDLFYNLAMFVLIFGWLGGKVLFIIVEFKRFIQAPMSVIGSEGFVVYGGILSGLVTIYVYCKIKKLDFLSYIDVIVAAVAINQGFGRIGCFLAGCCYGRETDSWPYVIFPEGCMAPAGIKLVPTQIYSALGDFIMFLVLMIILNSKKYIKGVPVTVYLAGYAFGRSVIECFRSDARGSVGTLSTSQFISIFTGIAGVIALIIILKRDLTKRKNAENTGV
ncbi:MAG: prolipoprotein diacylglyceryl transferase [Lachnospiraceae bacterium]|nr:prolipoprotein diacylglyceryl transferase [Lachnospiraceae bacterium]